MKRRGYRKQILLFLVAVILPSFVLVAFTLRMVSQEKELAQKRMADERRRLAREIGQYLLVRLEKIELQEAMAVAKETQLSAKINYVNPEVVLIGQVDGRQLLLPWETDQQIEECRKLLSSSDFAQKIHRAEKEEFANKNFLQAVQMYRQAMKTAQEPVQKYYAQFLLARTLAKSGQRTEALSHFQHVLEAPPEITDEYGVALSLYAAGRLLDAGEGYEKLIEIIRAELEANRWLSPPESYMLGELAEKLAVSAQEKSIQDAAKNLQPAIKVNIQKLGKALAFQRDFQNLALTANQESGVEQDEPLWVSYGEGPWLVSLTQSLAGLKPLLIAVQAQKILASLNSDVGFSKSFPVKFQFVTSEISEGEPLGANFRGLKIAFAASENINLSKEWDFRRLIYLLALLLVLSVTLFGAYLLWRDVRREVRLAEMRSQFVSSVSHELKTPLTAIRMFAETLRLGRSKNQKMSEEYLDTIVNESERLTRLLNNVLDFSKIEQGKRIYRPEPTHLSDVIQATARAMEYPLSQQGFKLHVYAEEELPSVRVDRDAIEQAILNLLHNALKYSGESRDIDLRLQRKDRYAVIQVIDRGIGIDPKEQRRIFEKFYRIPSEENKRMTGTGLGLALASHIVEAHGGQIAVESAPGKGSTFSIYLPLEKEQ